LWPEVCLISLATSKACALEEWVSFLSFLILILDTIPALNARRVLKDLKKEIEQFPTVDDISIDYRDTNLELIEKLLASINKKRSSNDSTSTNHSKPTNNTIKV
jgi:hypothetical protein